MRIQQCKVLNVTMKNRFSYFFKRYNLKNYDSKNKPSIFFSLWGYGALKRHKSFALVIWRGTDILKVKEQMESIKKMKNVYHVAISSYIIKDLDRYGIKCKFIPIVGVNNKYFRPCPMGDEIYVYLPSHNTKYYERYGASVVKKIEKKCKYKINIVPFGKYTRKQLIKIYGRCFCGLRMTKHDGLPNQVIEMGLMGRKSFYNGNIPGVINWNEKNIDQILENIETEACKIGTTDYNYSEQIHNFINVGNKWLDTTFWEN